MDCPDYDSPVFRARIDKAESQVITLESRIDKVIKRCSAMIDAGKAYDTSSSAFLSEVRSLTLAFNEDYSMKDSISRYVNMLEEIHRYHNMVIDQTSRCVLMQMKTFVSCDIKQVKELQTKHKRVSDDYESSLTKHSSAPKNKPQESDELMKQMLAAKSSYLKVSEEYSNHLDKFEVKQRSELLHTMYSYASAWNTYFHQGHEHFEENGQFLKGLVRKVNSDNHDTEIKSTSQLLNSKGDGANFFIEGYLFKKTHKGFKPWARRWFVVENNRITYTKRLSDGWSVLEEDLRLCAIKPYSEGDRKYCLEIKLPSRSHILQASDEADCARWMSALQSAVAAAYESPSHHTESHITSTGGDNAQKSGTSNTISKARQISLMYSVPGNSTCADCKVKDPSWASINLGITLCIQCCGVHRNLGVQFSKVRSIYLDSWEPEILKTMSQLGNTLVNSVYEENLDKYTDIKRPKPLLDGESDMTDDREIFIRCKYVCKKFIQSLDSIKDTPSFAKWTVLPANHTTRTINKEQLASDVYVFSSKVPLSDSDSESDQSQPQSASDKPDLPTHNTQEHTTPADQLLLYDIKSLTPELLLYKAAEMKNLSVMVQSITNSAEINWRNTDESGKTTLIRSVELGFLTICEFLLLNGADVNITDADKRTALHHATANGHTAQVCQLLKRNADYKLLDSNGSDVLQLAVQQEHADIVTLLRVACLRQEMNDSDPTMASDDMLNDVLKDFVNIASENPERLRRNKTTE